MYGRERPQEIRRYIHPFFLSSLQPLCPGAMSGRAVKQQSETSLVVEMNSLVRARASRVHMKLFFFVFLQFFATKDQWK
jgi:hypothetical protein